MNDEGERDRRTPPPERARQQRLAASKRGAAAVQRAFAEVLTRRVFAERVGVHLTTVRRWEAHGIVEPALVPILGIPTLIFTEDDVMFAKALLRTLTERPGELSLRQAAEIVRKKA